MYLYYNSSITFQFSNYYSSIIIESYKSLVYTIQSILYHFSLSYTD